MCVCVCVCLRWNGTRKKQHTQTNVIIRRPTWVCMCVFVYDKYNLAMHVHVPLLTNRRELRPCLDCQPKSDFWHVQIISWLIFESVNSKKTHEIWVLQIWFGPHLEVVWNRTWVWFVQMRLNQILECLLRHSMDIWCLNGVSWWTRLGVRYSQSLTNIQRGIRKFALHLSSSSVPTKTRSHSHCFAVGTKPLAAQWSPPWQNSNTEHRVESVWCGGGGGHNNLTALYLDSRIYFSIGLTSTSGSCITNTRTDVYVVTTVTHADRSFQSSDVRA